MTPEDRAAELTDDIASGRRVQCPGCRKFWVADGAHTKTDCWLRNTLPCDAEHDDTAYGYAQHAVDRAAEAVKEASRVANERGDILSALRLSIADISLAEAARAFDEVQTPLRLVAK